MPHLAVLTGDIVKSSTLPAGGLAQIFDGLDAAAAALSGWQDQAPHLTRARGDSWQAVCAAPFAFRAALAFRAGVRMTGKGHDTRIGLAIGDGTVNGTGTDLADADGPAFVASGRALDEMARTARLSTNLAPATLRAALPLADHISSRWTVRQAQIALASLAVPTPTQDALADHFEVSRQTIHRLQDTAGIRALVEVCEMLEHG
ncbi:hypothetical protein [Pseudosulfitobacter koreensis]|uniref:SatD family (SatD) n=1 Tax=Pseudosulfitobacter koreensis TaxID=2968472 RepID=A0ABT1YXJ1_9RHOB|nr:hypothetical protein [Pseudosulfitobacter koreense]MCR8825601.1 hypothetical protein [Pseudosulfitobacter koreense]